MSIFLPLLPNLQGALSWFFLVRTWLSSWGKADNSVRLPLQVPDLHNRAYSTSSFPEIGAPAVPASGGSQGGF